MVSRAGATPSFSIGAIAGRRSCSDSELARADLVAYLAPNTHAQLESFYSVPQLGGVLVPLNFRLNADDFIYLINHSGARVVCAHRDYLETINKIRSRLPCVEHFVALTGEVGVELAVSR